MKNNNLKNRISLATTVEVATSVDFAKQTKTLRRAEEGVV